MEQYTTQAITPENDFEENHWYKIEKIRKLQKNRFGRSESLAEYSRKSSNMMKSLQMERLQDSTVTMI